MFAYLSSKTSLPYLWQIRVTAIPVARPWLICAEVRVKVEAVEIILAEVSGRKREIVVSANGKESKEEGTSRTRTKKKDQIGLIFSSPHPSMIGLASRNALAWARASGDGSW